MITHLRSCKGRRNCNRDEILTNNTIYNEHHYSVASSKRYARQTFNRPIILGRIGMMSKYWYLLVTFCLCARTGLIASLMSSSG